MKMNFIHCKKCNKDYLVGLDGKSITGKGSFGKENDISFFSISNDEIEGGEELKETTLCPNCSTVCEVKSNFVD